MAAAYPLSAASNRSFLSRPIGQRAHAPTHLAGSAARDLGISRGEAWRADTIAALAAEAKRAARDAGLDNNQSALLTAAGKSVADQADTIRAIHQAGNVTVFKLAADPSSDAQALEKQVAKLHGGMERRLRANNPNLRPRGRSLLAPPAALDSPPSFSICSRVRLSEFPWVVVRLDCAICARKGQYRLARLAAMVGPELELDAVLQRIAYDCPQMRPDRKSRKYVANCGIRFTDLERSAQPPPDLPPAMVRLRVVGGRDKER